MPVKVSGSAVFQSGKHGVVFFIFPEKRKCKMLRYPWQISCISGKHLAFRRGFSAVEWEKERICAFSNIIVNRNILPWSKLAQRQNLPDTHFRTYTVLKKESLRSNQVTARARMGSGCLAIGKILTDCSISNQNCLSCGNIETVEHLFLSCAYAQAIWRLVILPWSKYARRP